MSKQISESWIRIDIAYSKPTLTIKVENSKNPDEAFEMKPVSGIGLQNVRKRLELIYPDRHQLEIHDEEESYLIVLKLDLPEVQVKNEEQKAVALKHRQA